MHSLKKTITSSVLALSMLIPSVCYAKAEAISGWGISLMGSCDADVFIDAEEYYAGGGAMKIENRSAAVGNVYVNVEQSVPIEAGKRYYIGTKVKTKNAQSAVMLLDWDWNTQHPMTQFGSTYDWTNFEWIWVAPKDGTVTYRVIVEGTGTVWLDDCKFVDAETGENLIKNSSFDAGSAKDETLSEEKFSNDELYNAIMTNETFSEEDYFKINGAFGYIPVYPAKNITVDGNGDDWNDYFVTYTPTLTTQFQNYINDGKEKDNIASCKFAYDEDYFYVYAEVKDNKFIYDDSLNYWDSDGLQLAFGSLDEYFGQQVDFNIKDDSGNLAVVGFKQQVGNKPIIAKGRRKGENAVYEIAYPWDEKFGKRPDSMKFNFLMNDNDGAGRRYASELAPGIAEGKTNAQFPVMHMVTEDLSAMRWIKARGGNQKITNTDIVIDYFYVNTQDTEKNVKVYGDGMEETVLTVAPHTGIRGSFIKNYEAPDEYTVQVTFDDGTEVYEATEEITVKMPDPTAETAPGILAQMEEYARNLRKKVEECNSKGIETQYETTYCNVLDRFCGYMAGEIKDGNFTRINYSANAMTNIYNKAMKDLDDYLAGKKEPLAAPLYVDSEIGMDKDSFWAEMLMPDGTTEYRPVYFNGYGHGLGNEDISAFPSIASNSLQFEVGASQHMSVFPAWESYKTEKARIDITMLPDKENVKEGDQSLKVIYRSAQSPGRYNRLINLVQLEPGKNYTLKGWVKSDGTEGDITVMFGWEWGYSKRFSGSFDWQEFEMKYKASREMTEVSWIFEVPTTGFWIDGMTLCSEDDPDTNLLANGGFEIGNGKDPMVDENSNFVKDAIKKLDIAYENGIYVDFLVGPHYFFEDVIREYDIRHTGGSYLEYNIHAPIAKKIIEEHLRSLIAAVKDHPALKSVCITNEPAFYTWGCGDFYNEDWWKFLSDRYNGNIEELNQAYGSNYTAFNEIDQDANITNPAKNFDYWIFNTQVFADWHKWMADIVRDVAPDIRVHAKIMAYREDTNSPWTIGIDPEKFVDFIDVSGTDAYSNTASLGMFGKAFWYDYLKSLKDTPIIDSENHNVMDGSSTFTTEIARKIAQDVYLGSVHGRTNAISWHGGRGVGGQIMYRPDALAWAVDAGYDMNRLSYELRSLLMEEKEVAILHASPSIVNNQKAQQAAFRAYVAVATSGRMGAFVVESQLEKLSQYKMLIVPYSTYVSPETLEAIAGFIRNGGKVLIMNEASLSKTDKNLDSHKETRDFIFANSKVIDFDCDWDNTNEENSQLLNNAYRELQKEMGLTYAEIIDVKTGKHAELVEYEMSVYNGNIIFNIANHKEYEGDDVDVKLYINGKEITERLNLRTMEKETGDIHLLPNDVITYQIEIDNPFFDTYNHWSDEEVAELYGKGLVNGVSESRFNPQASITRAEFLALVNRASGFEEAKYNGGISDVNADMWYADTVQAALDAGIITSGNFRPDEAITREEMCEILISAYEKINGAVTEYGEAKFTDNGDISDIEVVSKAASLKIVNGMEDGKFVPAGNATRAEAAAVINRFDDLKKGE